MGLIEPIELPDPEVHWAPVHFIAIGGSGMNGIASVMVAARRARSAAATGRTRRTCGRWRRRARGSTSVTAAEQLGEAPDRGRLLRDPGGQPRAGRGPAAGTAGAAPQRRARLADARSPRDRGRRDPRQDDDDRDDLPTSSPAAAFDPSFVIGGALTGTKTGGHLGGGELMVVEADESDGSFLQYPAEIAVVTNVDPDHLINWGTAENYADGFLRFATGRSVRLLVVSADDPGAVALTERVRALIAAGAAPRDRHLRRDRDADVRIAAPASPAPAPASTARAGDRAGRST